MITMYGIPNCDTVKKAKKALEASGVEYEFVDFKKTKPSKKNLKEWKAFFGEWPINKRGTTFRKLKEEFEGATDAKLVELMIENTSVIKRPVLEKNGKVLCLGFDKDIYAGL